MRRSWSATTASAITTIRKLKEFSKDPTLFPLPPNTRRPGAGALPRPPAHGARLVVERQLNEEFGEPGARIGLVTHGTTFNTMMRLLSQPGPRRRVRQARRSRPHRLHLNVIYPLNDDQIADFLADKTHVLLIEEGQPELIELMIRSIIQKRGLTVRFSAHDRVPRYGELMPAGLRPLGRFSRRGAPGARGRSGRPIRRLLDRKAEAVRMFPVPVPPRPPTFCTGCPERPGVQQMKISEYTTGIRNWHAGDVGCYGMAGYAPFFMADSNIGMGAGLAAAGAVSALSEQHNVSVVGDGTLWHSAFTSSAANAIYNKQDSTYVVLDNKWTAMTGAHENPNVGRLMNGEARTPT